MVWFLGKTKTKIETETEMSVFLVFENRLVSGFTPVRFGFSVTSVFRTKLCKIQKIESII
ncbi:hypothetical protein HanIR_Chr03g0140731 [Helianthus annuus]|nr:hypothetical protein HanIR_Chr03g0140731 [Helianthus annuus]